MDGWVLDTCVMLDIGLADPAWLGHSLRMIEDHRRGGLVLCPVSVAELAPSSGGDMAIVRALMARVGAHEGNWISADSDRAGAAWHAFCVARRIEGLNRRPIADLMIGAFACRHRGLLTRNAGDFQRWFPELRIVQPAGI